jgi:hypothetical protein
MFQGMITKNLTFLQVYMIFIVVYLVCLFNGNLVFGQAEDETSQPSFWDWLYDSLDTFAPYAALGATVATAVLSPLIVQRWKNRQSKIELQTKIVAEINELIMNTLVAIMKVEEYKDENKFYQKLEDRKKARNDQYYKEFKVKSHVIQSEIQAYFIGCLKQWNVLIDLIQFVERLSDKEKSKERRDEINKYLNPDKYLNEYEPLEQKINEEEKKKGVFRTLLNDAIKKFKESHHDELEKLKELFKESHPHEMEKFEKRHHDAQWDEVEFFIFKTLLADKNVDAWYEVKHAIVDRKNEIITNILDSKGPFPSKLKDKNNKKEKEGSSRI